MPDDSKRTTPAPNSPRAAGKVQRFTANTSASAAEMTEFLTKMRGKNPQEVLGMVAASSLVRSTGVALGVTVALMLLLTLIPAWTASDKPVAPQQGAGATTPANQANVKQGQNSDKSNNATAKNPASNGSKDSKAIKNPNKADVADKLGINGAKDPDKSANPLDSIGDDLLKNLD
jgi:hypothetical protein